MFFLCVVHKNVAAARESIAIVLDGSVANFRSKMLRKIEKRKKTRGRRGRRKSRKRRRASLAEYARIQTPEGSLWSSTYRSIEKKWGLYHEHWEWVLATRKLLMLSPKTLYEKFSCVFPFGPVDVYGGQYSVLLLSRLARNPWELDLARFREGKPRDCLYLLLDQTALIPSPYLRSRAKWTVKYWIKWLGLPNSDQLTLKISSPTLKGTVRSWLNTLSKVIGIQLPEFGPRLLKNTRVVVSGKQSWKRILFDAPAKIEEF